MYSTSQIKDLLKRENLRIKKSLGQNFLVDKIYIDKIISHCNLTKNDLVLEIGPGLSALTEILAQRCKKLIAVEKDKHLCSLLKEQFANHRNVEIVCADILRHRLSTIDYRLTEKFKVIGNLPYYITSPIITYLINNRAHISSAYVTVQKEVADRLVSAAGGKDYSSISCFVQFYCKPEILLKIPKKVFYPQPEVESAFVRLEFLKNRAVVVKSEDTFFKVVRAAFGKRRKTILNAMSLSALAISKDKLSEILPNVGIDPKRRGETLTLQEFAKIERKISEDQG